MFFIEIPKQVERDRLAHLRFRNDNDGYSDVRDKPKHDNDIY